MLEDNYHVFPHICFLQIKQTQLLPHLIAQVVLLYRLLVIFPLQSCS